MSLRNSLWPVPGTLIRDPFRRARRPSAFTPWLSSWDARTLPYMRSCVRRVRKTDPPKVAGSSNPPSSPGSGEGLSSTLTPPAGWPTATSPRENDQIPGRRLDDGMRTRPGRVRDADLRVRLFLLSGREDVIRKRGKYRRADGLFP